MGCHDGLRISDEEQALRTRVRLLREKLKTVPLGVFMASDFAALNKVVDTFSHNPSREEVELLEKRIKAYQKENKVK